MTNGADVQAKRAFRLSAAHRIGLLTASVALVAVVLFVVVVRLLPGAPTAIALPWGLWAGAFVVCESLVVYVQWQREAHAFSMGDLVLGAGLLLAVPRELILAQVVGYTLVYVVRRKQRGLKLAFNLALSVLGGVMATSIFALLTRQVGMWDWLAALIAVIAITVTADLCIFAVMSISEGSVHAKLLGEILALSLPFTCGSAAVGLVLGRTAVHDPASLALLLLPSLLIVVSYSAYTRAREQQENMRLLHEVTSLLHSGGDSHEALGDFLSSIRSAFRADLAELVLLGGTGRQAATVSRAHEGQPTVVMTPLDDLEDHARLLRLATPTGAIRTRSGARRGPAAQLEVYAAERGFKDAMVAVLRTEDRVHGLLLIAGRAGDVTTFSGADVALLETFARHVATSLERGRLEETLRQVTDLKEQLRHQALHDPLTGLPNRTLFLDRTRQSLDMAARSHVWPAILYIDLDGFKPVNDTYGHESGDLLLRTVADRLRGCLRPADTAARLGGDEFAILLNGPIDRVGAARVIERVRQQLNVPVILGQGVASTVRASIGVAIGDDDVADADGLVRQADIAMYTAKRTGGSSFVVYEPGLGDSATTKKDAAAELAGAIRDGQLFTVFQPLVDMKTGRPIGAEALVRWQHPVDGVRGPDGFIDVAEESGLIIELGAQVLRDACRQAARWVAAAPHSDDLMVTVNLSARQVAAPDIVEQVERALAETGLAPDHLVLEITETVLMHDREAAADTLWRLKALGVRIAIDDFGTGYSSLAYLRRFPIDMLKVAREFVDGLGRDANDDVITRAIVELADTLGLLTVAEGIETTQQQETVASLGCDIAQGYLFSRPVSADDVMELLSSQPWPELFVVPDVVAS